MKKRLRKKKHLAEFQEFGVSVDLKMRSVEDFERVWKALTSVLSHV